MYSEVRGNIFMIFLFIYMLILSIGVAFLLLFYPDLDMQIMNSVYQFAVFFVPSVLYVFIKKKPVSELYALKKISFKNIILIVLISLLVQPIIMLINALVNIISPNVLTDFMGSLPDKPFILSLFIVAITPAICEELVFRGILISEYRNAGLKKSMVCTGILFGLMHLNINQFFYAAPLGMLFAYFVYKTESIFSSMISHFVINASQVLLLYFTNPDADISLNGMSTVLISVFQVIIFCIISAIVLPFLFVLFKKFNELNEDTMLYTEKVLETSLVIDEENIYLKHHNRKNNTAFIVTFIIICIEFVILSHS